MVTTPIADFNCIADVLQRPQEFIGFLRSLGIPKGFTPMVLDSGGGSQLTGIENDCKWDYSRGGQSFGTISAETRSIAAGTWIFEQPNQARIASIENVAYVPSADEIRILPLFTMDQAGWDLRLKASAKGLYHENGAFLEVRWISKILVVLMPKLQTDTTPSSGNGAVPSFWIAEL